MVITMLWIILICALVMLVYGMTRRSAFISLSALALMVLLALIMFAIWRSSGMVLLGGEKTLQI